MKLVSDLIISLAKRILLHRQLKKDKKKQELLKSAMLIKDYCLGHKFCTDECLLYDSDDCVLRRTSLEDEHLKSVKNQIAQQALDKFGGGKNGVNNKLL